MVPLFRYTGIVTLILTVFIIIVNISYNPLIALMGGFFSLVGGLVLIALADTTERVNYLEGKLKIYPPVEVDEKLLQVTCPNCNTSHDFDYPKCPSCGYAKEG